MVSDVHSVNVRWLTEVNGPPWMRFFRRVNLSVVVVVVAVTGHITSGGIAALESWSVQCCVVSHQSRVGNCCAHQKH